MKTILFYILFATSNQSDVERPYTITYRDIVYEAYTVQELRKEFVLTFKK